ncbi:MAG: carboxypeptidase regulatory-like domain-containing protein, partial [Lachnospiraceae bacterium]|nr:carboxypeptidase regulatory-like domain-containing protein [Lachnospiraceae bacterium]
QYTQNGVVPGISGYVDMNVAYFTYSNEPDPVITTLTYQVTDETGAAVAGATVSMKGEMTRKTLTATTDDSGNAVFQNVVVDSYAVSVSQMPSAYEKASGSSLTIQFGKAEASYNGSLQVKRIKAPSVTYQVVDQAGQAVAGVTVTLKGTTTLGNKTVEVTAVTDKDGKAIFGDILAGSYQISTSKAPEGYQLLNPVKVEEVKVTSSAAVTGSQKLTVEKIEEKPSESGSESESESSAESGSEGSSDSTEGSAGSTESGAPETTTQARETSSAASETTTAAPETTTAALETTTAAPETTTAAPETTTAAPETAKAPSETTTEAPAAPASDPQESETTASQAAQVEE